MKQYRDFENDPVRYGYEEGKEFLERLHARGQHFVPIVDSAIYAPNPENPDDAYPPYERGMEKNAFVRNPDGSTYYGAVWPGYTVFPDWVGAALNGTGAVDWWAEELRIWSEKVAFDGIWIDMSEVASFCVGSCGTGNLTSTPRTPFHLPGEPGNLVLQYPEGFDLTNRTEASSASSLLSSKPIPAPPPPTPTLPHHPTPGTRNINHPYALNNFHGDLAVHAISPTQRTTAAASTGAYSGVFEGYVVPMQEPGMTTAECRKNPWELRVALDGEELAEGELYLDDGESLEPDVVTWVHVNPRGNYVDTNALGRVTILGVANRPERVLVKGYILIHDFWSYDEDKAVLSLHSLNRLFKDGAWSAAWEINWE
ncbi:hypothetical protein N0V88_004202 [Collariella sp. IMI 366227]|nr:hypothetical protein N0V88_004202 [Collariella sp. IMI 366227]